MSKSGKKTSPAHIVIFSIAAVLALLIFAGGIPGFGDENKITAKDRKSYNESHFGPRRVIVTTHKVYDGIGGQWSILAFVACLGGAYLLSRKIPVTEKKAPPAESGKKDKATGDAKGKEEKAPKGSKEGTP